MLISSPTRLLTLDETAARLRKTPSQLRQMIFNRTAPVSAKIGGRRMFREEDVDAFIEQAFAAARAELETGHVQAGTARRIS